MPINGGTFAPVTVAAPDGCLVNPRRPAAVGAGNVETSQRLVDALLGALATAAPALVPAASQGTMNNVMIGGFDPFRERPFSYYETMGGGAGAGPNAEGAPGRHVHMTNTRNTPVEALEAAYPLRVTAYRLRPGTGGRGRHDGGSGVERRLRCLVPAWVTLISERRRSAPWGLAGGHSGSRGEDLVLSAGRERRLPAKSTFLVAAGDEVVIRSPGGGAWGAPESGA
jgi:N-methylhydantoinase B